MRFLVTMAALVLLSACSVFEPLDPVLCAGDSPGLATASSLEPRGLLTVAEPADDERYLVVLRRDPGMPAAAAAETVAATAQSLTSVEVLSANRGGGNRLLSGTSMASPHVAGVLALCRERHPEAGPAELRSCVLDASTPDVVKNPGAGSADRLVYAKDGED